jgi:hypothetical protein
VTVIIQYLLILLLICAILAVLRLYFVLGNVRQTLNNLEQTRTEVSGTLQRLEAAAATTEQVMREEVAPTLRVARETLVHVEVATRALADTTLVVRRLTGRADSVVSAGRLLSAGAPIAQFVASKSAGMVGSLLSGFGSGLRSLFIRHRPADLPKKEIASPSKAESEAKALP